MAEPLFNSSMDSPNVDPLVKYLSDYERMLVVRRILSWDAVGPLEILPARQVDDPGLNQRYLLLAKIAFLRQFIFPGRSDLGLSGVIETLESRSDSKVNSEQVASLGKRLGLLAAGDVGPIKISYGDDNVTTISELVKDALYSLYLHSDAQRHSKTSSRDFSSVNLALFMWLREAELFLDDLAEAASGSASSEQ